MKYFLSLSLLFLIVTSCNKKEYYKRILTIEEKTKYSKMFSMGSQSYQGSPDDMMVVIEALKLDSTNGAAWRERGVPFLKRGLGVNQEKYYSKARQYDPESWMGYSAYGYMYFYRDYKKAIELFDKLDTLTPNFIDYPQAQSIDLMRGLCHLKLNNLSEARRLLNKYIDYETSTSGRDFVDARGFLYLGIVMMEEQQFDKAVSTFEEGLIVDRNNAEILYQISKCQLALLNKAQAAKMLEQAEIQLQNGNQFTRAYVDEFYQIHQGHIDDLRSQIKHKS